MKYMGSKKRIATDIVNYINNIAFCEGITEYYEPFMGGCSVGELVQIENRHLSDINYHVVEMFKQVQKGMWDFKYIDKDEWHKIKADRFENKVYPAWLTGWCSVGCSFRGRCFEGFGGKYFDKVSNREVDTQLSTYNRLCEEREYLLGIDFSTRNYKEIGDIKGCILYCDAPYRASKQYTMVEKFDFEEYDQWLIEKSKDNLVLVSEYAMSGKYIDNFIELNSWTLNKSIGAGSVEDETSIERLFYIKDGWLTDKYFNQHNIEDDYDF